MAVVSRPLTLEEFLKLPEETPSLEYVDGAARQKVSPKTRHSELQAVLLVKFRSAGMPSKVAGAWAELRSTFGGASVVPDVSVYRWDRIPVDVQGNLVDDLVEPPDVAVEIVSPDQSVNALVRRCLWYVENGVQVALLIDPGDESVLAFRPGRQPAVWREAVRIDVDEILPDLELTVEELFSSLRYE